GGLDQPQKEPIVIAALRMPLHAKPKWPFRIFDGLDGAVGRAGCRLEARMADHRLVVVTADLNTITHEGSDPGPFTGGDRRPAKRVAAWGALLVAPHIGE